MTQFQFDHRDFLANYWQQRPLLIRNALPDFRSPLSAEELAGLALEETIESRIVSRLGDRWILEHGPFGPEAFQRTDVWTLLVQGVDQWLPEVAALRDCVRFLPNWRFDDVMVSYAVDGGGVGPHFDRYDVFLLQGEGQRLWRLGDYCDDNTPRLEHESLNLLESFTTVEEYLLNPGDVLYVPPGMAHWGIAVGACMTYSLGFRAPPVAQLLARLTDSVLESLDPLLLLEDAGHATAGRPGEITPEHVANARQAVINAVTALDDGRWLGELVTDSADAHDLEPAVLLPGALQCVPGVSLQWMLRGDRIDVFVAGQCYPVPAAVLPLVCRLCDGDSVLPDPGDEAAQELLDILHSHGALMNSEEIE